MELTRRDALAALSAAGVAVGGGGAVMLAADDDDDGGEAAAAPLDDGEMATLVAAGEVLYPEAVGGVEEFVTRYATGRARNRPDHAAGMAAAAAYVNDYCRSWFDREFVALDRSTRESALRRMNADTAEPDPEGSDVQRVRYYVVNELLYALYSTPTGGKLVGIENPQGHPGGTTSYQRGPRQ